MQRQFTVSDGKLVLVLRAAEEGGYNVTYPFDPAVITQAETIEEAFENARDAIKTLRAGRARLMKQKQRELAAK